MNSVLVFYHCVTKHPIFLKHFLPEQQIVRGQEPITLEVPLHQGPKGFKIKEFELIVWPNSN